MHTFKSTISVAALGAVVLLQCMAPESDSGADPAAICENAPDGVGSWQTFEPPLDPIHEISLVGVTAWDGETFVFLHDDGRCDWCGQLYSLNSDNLSWIGAEVTGDYGMAASGAAFMATPQYALLYGGSKTYPEGGKHWRTYVSHAALLDRQTATWTHHQPPNLEGRNGLDADVFWTGAEFGIWGGVTWTGDDVVFDSSTVLTAHFDGALLDPATGEWRIIPALREAPTYRYEDSYPFFERKAVWTQSGLFVWGSEKEEEPFAAIFNTETLSWRDLEGTGPQARLEHNLVTLGNKVYLFGGYTREGGPLRDLWRYSLEDESWTEISVPRYADFVHGDVVGDRLLFMGACQSGSIYSPEFDSWELVNSTNAPIGPIIIGHVAGAPSQALINGVQGEYGILDNLWLLDLTDGSVGGAGGVGQ